MDRHVLLIYPPYFRLLGEARVWYPLGLGYLASYLKSLGINAFVYNGDSEFAKYERVMSYRDKFYHSNLILEAANDDKHFVWMELRRTIERVKPHAIGISVITETLPTVRKICEICKSVDKDVPIILGGPHTHVDAHFLVTLTNWDFILPGEAEGRLPILLNSIFSGKNSRWRNIGGLIFRDKGETVRSSTSYREVTDLDTLPFPNIDDMIGLDSGSKTMIRKTMIATTRGCPFKCSFCYMGSYDSRLRQRSVSSVVNEIRYNIGQHGINRFYFNDDTFGLNREFLNSFCKSVIGEKLNIAWSCMTHLRLICREGLELMKSAGCDSIHVGVESGSTRILELLNKDVSIDEVIEKCRLIKDCGIKLKAFFMAGLPDEDEEDMLKSMELLQEIEPYEAILQIYVPYPGTRLFRYIFENIGDMSNFYNWYEFYKAKVNYRLFRIHPSRFDTLLNDFFNVVEDINYRNGVYGTSCDYSNVN